MPRPVSEDEESEEEEIPKKRSAKEKAPKNAKKSKADDADEESKEKPKTTQSSEKTSIVPPHYKIKWDLLLSPFDQLKSIGGDLMDTDKQRKHFNDEKVPSQHLSAAHATVMQAIRKYEKWTAVESTLETDTIRFLWKSQKAYLLHLQIEGLMVMAIEDQSNDVSLVVGTKGDRPFIYASEFDYNIGSVNSEKEEKGSSKGGKKAKGKTTPPSLTPDVTLVKMAHDLLLHGTNSK
eukprot:TRINITY_DN1108_c0_g1_i1.p1 TRINITY_DN1108_c0_g1~~TRINITY_DN1108_c0_g1_i1.p1  ORF type:complete len:235 (+),score=80.73 TRINITY_DN1108_c0_g1_i1:638-1342(+)